MQKVKCGSEGLVVSQIGLGCMSMSSTYGPVDEVEAGKALQASLEAEMNFWDTADVYGGGANERFIAPFLNGHREQIVLASKCGITGRNADGLTLNGRPRYIYQACEDSLKRLNTDYIDLFYLHRVDPDVPIEESVGAIGELVSRGLVKYAGICEAGAETIRRAHGEFPLTAVQSEYSLFTRGVESEILPLLKELGIALVAYSPLGRGYLTGNITSAEDIAADDFRRQLPRFEEENLKKNLRWVKRVEEVARAHGATTAQIALAWLLDNESVIPIPGTKRPKYIFENAGAARIELGPQEREYLDFQESAIAGDRYPEILNKAVGR